MVSTNQRSSIDWGEIAAGGLFIGVAVSVVGGGILAAYHTARDNRDKTLEQERTEQIRVEACRALEDPQMEVICIISTGDGDD